jgi:hypothetical protein
VPLTQKRYSSTKLSAFLNGQSYFFWCALIFPWRIQLPLCYALSYALVLLPTPRFVALGRFINFFALLQSLLVLASMFLLRRHKLKPTVSMLRVVPSDPPPPSSTPNAASYIKFKLKKTSSTTCGESAG